MDTLPATVLLDGGMGRELGFRGITVPPTIWSAQALIDAPDIVQAVHADYILAGADIITTNTYCTLPTHLSNAGHQDRFEELARLAGSLAVRARDSVDRPVLVAGSLGPLFESYRPDLTWPLERAEPIYRQLAEFLADSVDLFICETMSKGEETLAAARAAVSTGKPVWVSWTLHPEKTGHLRSGESIAEARAMLADLPVSGFLANCCMPELIDAAMPDLVAIDAAYVGGYANTFYPTPDDWTISSSPIENIRVDLDPPAYLGFVESWLHQGATVIGGCCGTRPAHIRAIAELLGR